MAGGPTLRNPCSPPELIRWLSRESIFGAAVIQLPSSEPRLPNAKGFILIYPGTGAPGDLAYRRIKRQAEQRRQEPHQQRKSRVVIAYRHLSDRLISSTVIADHTSKSEFAIRSRKRWYRCISGAKGLATFAGALALGLEGIVAKDAGPQETSYWLKIKKNGDYERKEKVEFSQKRR
jgi:hypothetical protein